MSLDATVGGESANSYVTLVEADTYFSTRLHASSTWDSFVEKESALVTATSMLDWYMKWKGTKTSTSQNLDWPRTDVIGKDSIEVDSDIIPNDVKLATFELAFSILENDRTDDWDLQGLKSLKVDVLEIETSDATNNNKPNTIPDRVNKILKYLVLTSTSSIRTAFLVRR